MAERSRRQVKKKIELEHILIKERERSQMRQIRKILKKPPYERSEEEARILENVPELVNHIENTREKHKCLKERKKEIYDNPDDLSRKCSELAKALKESAYTVVYTGAGISTSAQIPDYRGPNGIWTLLQKGKEITFKDLSLAEPTFTHMALKQLHKEGYISHIVSQNCDGLHLRSGIPKTSLSELHGNMFIEVCPKCKPLRQYIRLFDVTERTALHRHKTGRFCKKCKSELNDTIVHFGEKGKLLWPMNWKGAVKAADKAEVILCLGSSLKVMRRYQSLWALDKPPDKRPKLYIVNLQWTPKDPQSILKIHGKCDEVMEKVMSYLGLDVLKYENHECGQVWYDIFLHQCLLQWSKLTEIYNELAQVRCLSVGENDPIFRMATSLTPAEVTTTSRHFLSKTSDVDPSFDMKPHADSSGSVIKNENIASLVVSNENTDQKLLKILDTSVDNEKNVKLEPEDRISDDCGSPEHADMSMNSLSGWYGKGLRKKKKTSISNKRLKTENDDV